MDTRPNCFMRISYLVRKILLFAFVLGALLPAISHQETFDETVVPSPRLNLLIVDVVSGYSPYIAFCKRNPTDCDMTGPDIVEFDTSIMQALVLVNRAVNQEITFTLDRDQYGIEEYWSYPRENRGDCEDIALEKRARLVRKGFPRGALRLAIVLHRKHLISHCILTVETTAGTYVLDSFSDVILFWHDTPYHFEARERNDGQWDRFDQGIWNTNLHQ